MKTLRPRVGLLLIAVFLLGLRLAVFIAAATSFSGAITAPLPQGMATVGHTLPFFLLSLSFEVLALLALSALSQTGRLGRWGARLMLFAVLCANLAGTVGYFTLRTYVKGFQLKQTNPNEVWTIGRSLANPAVLLGLGTLLVITLWFARKGSLERRRPGKFGLAMAVAISVLSLVGVLQLLGRPQAFPTVAHSPVTLLLQSTPQVALIPLPPGMAAAEDWAQVTELNPGWRGLAKAERHFNVVLVVLESTRASTFFPSADAPDLPHIQALAPHAALFTRAYAHEPLSLKAFEALEFGRYPAPEWQDGVGDAPAETLSSRWRKLGMKTALIEDSLPIPQSLLNRWGFSETIRTPEISRIDPNLADTALIKGLDRFIEGAGGQQFGAILWTRETHFPYDPPTPVPNGPPRNSYPAYRAAVARIDGVVAELTSMLERRHLADNTVVVLVGDHGEAFNEHPESGYAHGAWLFEESTHVPMMLINSRLFHGERDDRLVQQKDLAATLTWLAGDDQPNLNAGRCVFFERPSETAYLVNSWDVGSVRGGVVRGNLKYIFAKGAGDADADERLFDLTTDPLEQHDLWRSHPAQGLELHDRFFGWLMQQRAASRTMARVDPPEAPRRAHGLTPLHLFSAPVPPPATATP